MRSLLIAGSLFALSAPAYADANQDLTALVDDVWTTALKEAPVYASALGVNPMVAAELLPELEAVMVRRINEKIGAEDG